MCCASLKIISAFQKTANKNAQPVEIVNILEIIVFQIGRRCSTYKIHRIVSHNFNNNHLNYHERRVPVTYLFEAQMEKL